MTNNIKHLLTIAVLLFLQPQHTTTYVPVYTDHTMTGIGDYDNVLKVDTARLATQFDIRNITTDGDRGEISIASGLWNIDSGLDAAKVADGSVTSAEFQYINTLSSNAQTQLDAITARFRTATLTGDATANATTTGVEITGLNTTVGAGTYVFQYFIRYQSTQLNTGVRFGVNHTGTVTAFMATLRYQESTTAASTGTASQAAAAGTLHAGGSTRTRSTTTPNLTTTASVDATNSDMLAVIEGIVIVTVSGDLELWQAAENANSTTVKAGTSLILTKTD
jgi:hypothetical protein